MPSAAQSAGVARWLGSGPGGGGRAHYFFRRNITVSETTETYDAAVRPATETSILSGVGTIVGGVAEGVLEIAESAIDAQAHGVAAVADMAAMDYHSVAAGVDAFFGDAASSNEQVAAMKESRAGAWDEIRAIGADVGL